MKAQMKTFKSSQWRFELVLVGTQLTFICSNSTIETLEEGMKYVQK